MDFSSSSSSEDNLIDLTRKCMNIKQDITKENILSNLTAKYNKVRNCTNLYTCKPHKHNAESGFGDEVESKRKIKSSDISQNLGTVLKGKSPYSSEDDSDEYSGLSLAALAEKHKNIDNTQQKPCISKLKDSIQEKSKYPHATDSSSENEESSIFNLAAKNLVALKTEEGNKSQLTPMKPLEKECTGSKVNAKMMKSMFTTAQFSDDSDSDESSLTSLMHRHALRITKPGAGSDEDVSKRKTRELLAIINNQRQHTKSESDQFSITARMASHGLRKGFENETSTSLGSLGGNVSSGEFQFKLGCNLPSSFKSSNVSNNLTSSLSSFQMSSLLSNAKSSFSDPNVSANFKSPHRSELAKSPNHSVVNSHIDQVDGIFGGINLSCAIKCSSSARVSESLVSEDSMDMLGEAEEEEIVTLLDNFIVDEEMPEAETNSNKMPFSPKILEQCSYDSSHILKSKLKLRTSKCSSFGKLICRRWKPLRKPYIRTEKLNTTVVPFQFATPSPDDIILEYLERRH